MGVEDVAGKRLRVISVSVTASHRRCKVVGRALGRAGSKCRLILLGTLSAVNRSMNTNVLAHFVKNVSIQDLRSGMKVKTLVAALGVALTMNAFASVETTREDKEIDFQYNNKTYTIKLVIFQPVGRQNTPYFILNHARPGIDQAKRETMTDLIYFDLARHINDMGFTVIVPLRVGYGPGRSNVDIEAGVGLNGSCIVEKASETMADEAKVINDYVRTLPYVNPDKGIMGGHSYGGIMAVAAGAKNLPGIKGVVNVAGVISVQRPSGDVLNTNPNRCSSDLNETLRKYGKTTSVPNLWIYGERDHLAQGEYKTWYEDFKKAGGNVQLMEVKGGDHGIGQADQRSVFDYFFKGFAVENGFISE